MSPFSMNKFSEPGPEETGELARYERQFSDPAMDTWTYLKSLIANCSLCLNVAIIPTAPVASLELHDSLVEESPRYAIFDSFNDNSTSIMQTQLKSAIEELNLAREIIQQMRDFQGGALDEYARRLSSICRNISKCEDQAEFITNGFRLCRIDYERSVMSFKEWLALVRIVEPNAERRSIPERFVAKRIDSNEIETIQMNESLPRIKRTISQFYASDNADSSNS